jgi:hypothetical protein
MFLRRSKSSTSTANIKATLTLELDWLESASIDSDPVVVIWPTEDMSSMPIKPHDREIFGTISIY